MSAETNEAPKRAEPTYAWIDRLTAKIVALQEANRALLSERDAATARAEAAEARCDLFDTQAAAAKVVAAKAEAQRDAATAERDRLREALEKAAIAAEVESAGHAIAIIEAALTSAKEPSA